MNNIVYNADNGNVIVRCDPEYNHLIKPIEGARRIKGGWSLPVYRAQEVVDAVPKSFRISNRLITGIKPPEKKIERRNGHVEITAPKNASIESTVKELGGFKLNGHTWLVPDSPKIDTLFGNVTTSRPTSRINPELVLSKLPPLDGKMPNGWDLYDHQKESIVSIIRTKYKGKVVALDFGLGKTGVSSIAAMGLQLAHGFDVIIICPAATQGDWRKETRHFIKNPIILSDHHSRIPESHPHPFVLIVDEAHRLAGDSKRGKQFLDLAEKATFVMLLTGAPVRHGDPATAYNLLDAIDHPLGQIERPLFEARFSSHESSLLDFYNRTSDAIIRKKKEDCLDLPPKTRILREVEVDPESMRIFMGHYNKARDEYVKRKKGDLTNISRALVHYVRQAASVTKIPTTVEIVEELLEQNRQVIIFISYQETERQLLAALSKIHPHDIAVFTGSTPNSERHGLKERFQRGEIRVAVLNYLVGGFGLTLTAADTNILLDRPFSVEPNDVLNSEDRINRIGQQKPTTIVWLQFPYHLSPDKRLDEMILRKHTGNEIAIAGRSDEIKFRFENQLADYVAGSMFGNGN